MWSFFVISLQPRLGYFPYLLNVIEEVSVQDLLLKRSMNAFWLGFPGWMNISSRPYAPHSLLIN
jgi:hypothetical protein